MLRMAVYLLILALPALATSPVQDKGAPKGSDEPGSAKQSGQAQARPADLPGAASAAKSNCDNESAISEFGCAAAGPTGPMNPDENGSHRVAPGLFGRGSRDLVATGTPAIFTLRSGSPTYQQPELHDLRFLSEQADNPLTSLGSFAFETSYLSPPLGLKGWPGQVQTLYRSTAPVSIMGVSSTLHIRLPYAVASTGRSNGSGNVELLDLIGFSNRGGQWGAGAVTSFGSIDGLGPNTFQVGPALAFVTRTGRWQFGAVNRNLFSQHAAISSIQPVISFQAGGGWSLSTGDMEYRLDWHRTTPAAIPAGIQLGKLVEHGSRYYRFSVGPQYNVRAVYGAPRWTVTMGVTILGPRE